MIESLLVANRGEIARRIVRTARRLGVRGGDLHDLAGADEVQRRGEVHRVVGPDRAVGPQAQRAVDRAAGTLRVHTDGSDDPTGTAGNDSVSYTLAGAITHGGLLDVSMTLVNGRDQGHVEIAQGTFAVLDGSTAYVTLDGGQRGDQLSVNSDGAAGTIPIDQTSALDILIAGGSGADTITSDFSNVDALRLDGEFILLVSGGTGDDTIAVGLANTTDSTGLYDVTLRGDQDQDRFTVFLDDPSNGNVAYDSSDGGAFDYPTGYAIVAGGSGFNTADVFGNVALFNIRQS